MLSVGALIGSWILSGTVPAMIFYGTQLLHPGYFYAAACLICALSALCTGSSWTVAGTIGIGLIGTAAGLGMSLEITAGAVISGAYFGDKMSPLSDTTNLAPAVVGVDLFAHIRNMMWTTIPSISMALVMFLLLGGQDGGSKASQLEILNDALSAAFVINPWMLLPLALVLMLAIKKVPAVPTIIAGTAVGCVFAVVFQPQAVIDFVGDTTLPVPVALLKGTWGVLSNGYISTTGHQDVDSLLSRGGMSSMLDTIWLIVAAMTCGGLMEKAGILSKLVHYLAATAASSANLIMKTIVTCIGVNTVAADQYIAIVFPGRMYKQAYARRGLEAKTLSRVLEDSATITSPLIPWNTCGAFMAATLGVATFSYLPYCFFNLVNPLLSLVFAYLGVAMASKTSKSIIPAKNCTDIPSS